MLYMYVLYKRLYGMFSDYVCYVMCVFYVCMHGMYVCICQVCMVCMYGTCVCMYVRHA